MIDPKHIRALCREHGTTLSVVACKMYLDSKQPASQLSKSLRGNPRLDWLEKLAKAIGCSLPELFAPPLLSSQDRQCLKAAMSVIEKMTEK